MHVIINLCTPNIAKFHYFELVCPTESLDFTGVPRLVKIPQRAAEVPFNLTAICDEMSEYIELEIVIPDEYRSRVKVISPNMTRVNIIGKLLCICMSMLL